MSALDSGRAMSRHLLLVENDPDDEALAVLALRDADLDAGLVVVRDGASALDYLFATGAYATRDPLDLPEVVVLDLRLPKADGLRVLEEIRAREATRCLPVVVFSSSEEEEDVRRSYENGAASFVRKPMEFEAFQRTVVAVGLYWLSVNQPFPRARGR